MQDILQQAKDILERNKSYFIGTEIGRKYHILESAADYAILIQKSREAYKVKIKSLIEALNLIDKKSIITDNVYKSFLRQLLDIEKLENELNNL